MLEQGLREFRSFDELATAFVMGEDAHGTGAAIQLQLWSPTVVKELAVKRIDLRLKKGGDLTYRHRVAGAGLMQLYFGGVHENVLTKSHFGHFSKTGAEKSGLADEVSWERLKALSSKIGYQIRKRMAAAKVPGCHVLPHALQLAQSGYVLKTSAKTPWQYELL